MFNAHQLMSGHQVSISHLGAGYLVEWSLFQAVRFEVIPHVSSHCACMITTGAEGL
jgi:hypothetical protein